MKHLPLLGLTLLASASLLLADASTRDLQAQLKDQGFYFGEVNGATSPELSAALKRYQIRNGLEVTGQPNAETLGALGLAGGAAPAPAAPAPAPAPVQSVVPSEEPPAPVARRQTRPSAPPQVDLRVDPATVESDRRLLGERSRPVQRDPAIVPAPIDMDRPEAPTSDPGYADLYAATPFGNAPRPLQEQTLRSAQQMLANQRFYLGEPDGLPGPGTEEALLAYQRANQLPLSGRLDLETLNALRLLPGANSANPVLKPFTAPVRPTRTFRGVWVR